MWSEGGGSEEGCLSQSWWVGKEENKCGSAQLMTSVEIDGDEWGMIDVW